MHSYDNVQPAHGICNYVKGNGEFTLEGLNAALKAREHKRSRKKSKGYRNVTGRSGAPLTPAVRAL
jgi:hypothetical protein